MSVEANSPIGSSLRRWYIDTWPRTAADELLPLLSTLQLEDQEKVEKYIFLADRNMTLASCLLKYLFIHQSCLVPWHEIVISKTPAPHQKPCYIPRKPITDADEDEEEHPIATVEFNISHQASLVALAGYGKTQTTIDIPSDYPQPPVMVGIDITCTDESFRRRRKIDSIPHNFMDSIDNFTEVFSHKEINFLKLLSLRGCSHKYGVGNEKAHVEKIARDNRLFLTHWALKEAYTKMVGEGLLAPWIRELEFRNVVVPEPAEASSSNDSTRQWGPPVTGVEVFLSGKRVKDVRIELAAWGKDFLVATAGRSISDIIWEDFKKLDVERDISACANGECDCLQAFDPDSSVQADVSTTEKPFFEQEDIEEPTFHEAITEEELIESNVKELPVSEIVQEAEDTLAEQDQRDSVEFQSYPES